MKNDTKELQEFAGRSETELCVQLPLVEMCSFYTGLIRDALT